MSLRIGPLYGPMLVAGEDQHTRQILNRKLQSAVVKKRAEIGNQYQRHVKTPTCTHEKVSTRLGMEHVNL